MKALLAPLIVGVTIGGLAGWACGPDPDEFFNRLFPCDTNDPASTCGTNRGGEPMVCFAGREVGLRDFCVDRCDTPGEDEDTVCLGSGARLRKCRPSRDADPAKFPNGPCGNRSLACLRTDLLLDEGVCVMGTLCSRDSDCKDPERSTCASSVLKELVDSPLVKADHLQCVQYGCQGRGATCAPGESCLPNLVPPQSKPPDVCVPHCDSSLNCPPNYICSRKTSMSATAPDVCVAGLASFRCESRIDCLVGDCLEVVSGIKVCSVPCARDADCLSLERLGSPQVCGQLGGGRRACVSVDLFGGTACLTDSECAAGSVCTRYSPYATSVAKYGYCLIPCQAGQCAPQAGVPHTCFDFLDRPVCYPGKLGLYCSVPEACMADLQCRQAVQLDENDEFVSGPICTLPCDTDADCIANHLGQAARANCEHGFCVNRRRGGRLCDRDDQCESDRCALSMNPAEAVGRIRRCAYPPGSNP